jgi:glutathione S-transferase
MVKEPKMAEQFNCVQRAHQNTLENWAPIQILMLVNGLVYPCASAALGLVWVLGRILYGYGYATKGPKGRMFGGIVINIFYIFIH